MPSQMKRTSFTPRPAKAGTKQMKATKHGYLFKPRTQGISAHGTMGRVESYAEEKDRLVG